MKKKMLIMIVFISSIISCKKDKIETPTQVLNYTSKTLKSLFDANKPAYEKFVLTCVNEKMTVLTSHGTTVTFNPTKFYKLPDYKYLVPGETFELYVKEISKPSEMIYDEKPTVARDTVAGVIQENILNSFGELIVEAKQDEEKLYSTTNTDLEIEVSNEVIEATTLDSIQVFNGDSIFRNIKGHNYLNEFIDKEEFYKFDFTWSLKPSSENITVPSPPNPDLSFTSPSSTVLPIFAGLNNWRNCDVYTSFPQPKTTLLVYFKNHNYLVRKLFMKVENHNMVVSFNRAIVDSPSDFQGLLSYQNLIPTGVNAEFIAIAESPSGEIFASYWETTIPAPSAGKNYISMDAYLEPISASGMESLISNFDN